MVKKPNAMIIKMPKSRKKIGWITIVIIVLLIIFIICDYIFVIRKSKVLAPEVDNTQQNSVNNKIDSNVAVKQNQPVDTATNYYNQGLNNFNTKNYQAAVSNFSQAINVDPQNETYYSKKAQAEMNLSEKDTAISTIKTGLSEVPNSELLKSQLDVLQNNSQLGNQDGVK